MSEENKYLMYIKCDRKCHICEHYKNEILLQQKEQKLISMLEGKLEEYRERYELFKKTFGECDEDVVCCNAFIMSYQEILDFIKENKE